jgi:hypothetical protein
LAKFQPRVGAQRQPWINSYKKTNATLKGFAARRTLSGFNTPLFAVPGLKLANAFGVLTTPTKILSY